MRFYDEPSEAGHHLPTSVKSMGIFNLSSESKLDERSRVRGTHVRV